DTHAAQGFYRFVIEYLTVFYNTIMAIDRIRIQRHVGHHEHSRFGFFYRADTSLHKPVGVPGFAAGIVFVFVSAFDEQLNRSYAKAIKLLYFLHGQVSAIPEVPGHGWDLRLHFLTLFNK